MAALQSPKARSSLRGRPSRKHPGAAQPDLDQEKAPTAQNSPPTADAQAGVRTKSPTSVDVHVGVRMRTRRQILHMSQTELAEQLGVTFQQLQKYEKGGNRISASRLLGVAAALDVPMSYFFEGLDGTKGGKDAGAQNVLADRQGMELLRAFNGIADQTVRGALIDLAKALSPAQS